MGEGCTRNNTILSIPFCPYHFVLEPKCLLQLLSLRNDHNMVIGGKNCIVSVEVVGSKATAVVSSFRGRLRRFTSVHSFRELRSSPSKETALLLTMQELILTDTAAAALYLPLLNSLFLRRRRTLINGVINAGSSRLMVMCWIGKNLSIAE